MKKTNINQSRIKVGIVGTGFVGRGLSKLLISREDLHISGILTRRKGHIAGLGVEQKKVTPIPDELMTKSDIIFVSTGDPVYSTEIIDLAFKYSLPVVTLDTETHIVSGSWLKTRGLVTESDGDQPGCLAALHEEAILMGFTPLVYGNIKWFLDKNPSRENMEYWSKKQGYSFTSVMSFTDGTKVQSEQCLVANGLHANILQQGMHGNKYEGFEEGAFHLAHLAHKMKEPISDYILCPKAPPGVFISATHQRELARELATYKMGDGPYYLLHRPYHLCLFEVPKTILQVVKSGKILLDNGARPKMSVAAIAKKKLLPGTFIEKGIGSMEVRGEILRISEHPNHVPVGLMQNVRLKNSVDPGQIIMFSDIDSPESKAKTAWENTLRSTINRF